MKLNRDLSGPALYPILLGGLLATGWLLPNHYPPWNTFHTNAWIATALLLIAFWRLGNDRTPLRISAAALFLAAVSLVPLAQYAIGLVPLGSDAFMSSMYLVGVAAAFVLGEHWARSRPGEPGGMVLAAAAAAALVSSGLQVYQWLGLAVQPTWQEFWIFPSGVSRPYANLGQPNQLASLLLWGVLGVAWAWRKGWLRGAVACALAAFILFGVALSESRTAALTLTVSVAYLSLWRPAWLEKGLVRAFQGLYLLYLGCLFGIGPLSRLVGQDSTLTVFKRSAGEMRVIIWRMAIDAAGTHPWLGFGWNRTNEAFLTVFPRYPALADMYLEQSHNLVLDLALWAGIPLAAVLVLGSLWWLLKVLRSVTGTERLLQFAALLVMLVHAMLELPLHHGYFLWPFALIAGSLTAGLDLPALMLVPRRVAAAGSLALSLVAAVLVHDYFLVEDSFKELRMQLQHIGHGHDESRPAVLVLQDWGDFIAMSRTQPKPGMSAQELRHWQDLLLYNTSPLAFRKLMEALAVNGHIEEARYWGVRSCAVLVDAQCKAAQREFLPPEAQPPVAQPALTPPAVARTAP